MTETNWWRFDFVPISCKQGLTRNSRFFCLSPQELLEEINKKENEDDGENEMEITWEMGLKEGAEEIVKRKKNEKEKKELTPWENYLNERKQKKKTKQQAKQSKDQR